MPRGSHHDTCHPPPTFSLKNMAAVIHFWLPGWYSLSQQRPKINEDVWDEHLFQWHSTAQNSIKENRECGHTTREARRLCPATLVSVMHDCTRSQYQRHLPLKRWHWGHSAPQAALLGGTPTLEFIPEPHGSLASSQPSTFPPQLTPTSRWFPKAFPAFFSSRVACLGKCHQWLDRFRVTAGTCFSLLTSHPQAQCSLLDPRVRKTWDF